MNKKLKNRNPTIVTKNALGTGKEFLFVANKKLLLVHNKKAIPLQTELRLRVVALGMA